MSKEKLVGFGAGEVTPELIERSNLTKMKTGLRALRNATVSKFGGVRGRRGFITLRDILPADNDLNFYAIIEKGLFFVITKSTIYTYEDFDFNDYSFATSISADFNVGLDFYTTDQLASLHFTSDDDWLYISCPDGTLEIIRVDLNDAAHGTNLLATYEPPFYEGKTGTARTLQVYSSGFSAPTGYEVEYACTHIRDDVESFVYLTQDKDIFAAAIKLPVNTGEANNVRLVYTKAAPVNTVDEIPETVYFYRRPRNAGAWGFVGSATANAASGTAWEWLMIDFGQDADFANQPPDYVKSFTKETSGLPKPSTAFIYQNRLMISIRNKIFGSRTDAPNVMSRDFPLQDDSAISFATGSDGGANVGRMYDSRGLLISTTRGIYETPSEALVPGNAIGIKRSNVRHDKKVPIIGMGSSTFVTDTRKSGVFRLVPAVDGINLDTLEVSIFSAHLFKNRKVVSWAVQDDGTSLLWIVLDNGQLLSFSFQQDQELQGWARHDTLLGDFKQVHVIDTDLGQVLIAIVELEDGEKSIQIYSQDYQGEKAVYDYVQTDGTVIFKNQMLAEGETVTWDGVTLTTSAATFLNTDGLGAVGSIFRFFNFETSQYVDMIVTAYTSSTVVEAKLYSDIDFEDIMGGSKATEMYQTFTNLESVYMGALNDKEVAIRADGFTHASPLNNDPAKNYIKYTVTEGSITLPEEYRSAFVSVGLPIVTDIQTLSQDTIEAISDRETSQIVNRAFISYYDSRGFYIGSYLPEDNTLTDMNDHEVQYADDIGSIIPTKPIQPYSLKQEVTLNGDWQAGNSVALRNVDPQPVGIRGLILDVESGE